MFFLRIFELIARSPAKRDKIILLNLILSLIFIFGLLAALIFNFYGEKEYVIFHYNIYFGISSLAAWWFVLLLPLLGLLITAVNFLLSFYFYLRRQILSYFLAFGAMAFNFILLLAGGLIIYINL